MATALHVEPRPASARDVATPVPSAALLRVDGVTLQYKTADHVVTATYRVGFDVHEQDRFVCARPLIRRLRKPGTVRPNGLAERHAQDYAGIQIAA
jgi:hypothetical protein